ncbi:MAG: hypothetical protein IKG14_06175 [Clostridia bacterium]|nr:hypothetical protein [Clostridia bacterium]
MTKEELKNYLTEKGASTVLMQKPAIMERIYSCFDIDSAYGLITGNFYETIKSLPEAITVDQEGNITINSGINTRIFKQAPNNEAIYINEDKSGYSIDEEGEYTIDKYGMDKAYSNGSDHIAKREENGTVEIDGVKVADNGSPILNLYDLVNSNQKKAWYKNKTEITNNYPTTKEWYIRKEKQVKGKQNEQKQSKQGEQEHKLNYKQKNETSLLESQNYELIKENAELKRPLVPKEQVEELKIEKRRSEIERNIYKEQVKEQKNKNSQLTQLFQEQTNKNQRLEEENEKQKQEIQSLKERNYKLQTMLKQTLDFCESVRNSFLGRFFFGSKLKQLPAGSQTKQQTRSIQNKEEHIDK